MGNKHFSSDSEQDWEEEPPLKKGKLDKTGVIAELNSLKECKKLWEIVRKPKLTKLKREAAIKEMMGLCRGNTLKTALDNNSARIIFYCVKYGIDTQRNEIAEKLKNNFVELSQKLYGHRIVLKLLKYCKKYRTAIISSFYGQVTDLISHKYAALVIEECFSKYSNATQKTAFMQEFYGSQFEIDDPKSLAQILAEKPENTPSILDALSDIISSLLKNESIQFNTIIHRLLLEFFRALEASSMTGAYYHPNSKISELIDSIKDHLHSILYTREGSQVAQLSILHATPKQREEIVHYCNPYAAACDQYGSSVLFSLFECVDDTSLVCSTIVTKLLSDHLTSLLRNKHGIKVILFLLQGRSNQIIPGSVVDELEKMDVIRSSTCRKSDNVKHTELSLFTRENLSNALCNGEDLDIIIRCKLSSSVLTYLTGIPQMLSSIASMLTTTSKPVERDSVITADLLDTGIILSEHPLANRNATIILKKIINTAIPSVLSIISRPILDGLLHWVKICTEDPQNTAGVAYILLAMLERGDDSVVGEMKQIIGQGQKEMLIGTNALDIWRKDATPDVKETGIEKFLCALSK